MIQKGTTRLMVMDQTRIMVPVTLRQTVLDRELVLHVGRIRMANNIRAKYFWPRMENDVKEAMVSCLACQMHGKSQTKKIAKIQTV